MVRALDFKVNFKTKTVQISAIFLFFILFCLNFCLWECHIYFECIRYQIFVCLFSFFYSRFSVLGTPCHVKDIYCGIDSVCGCRVQWQFASQGKLCIGGWDMSMYKPNIYRNHFDLQRTFSLCSPIFKYITWNVLSFLLLLPLLLERRYPFRTVLLIVHRTI